MLSPAQIAIVKQTVPVLKAHGETLTRHFYARMFEHNPEVKRYFNPANQRSGAQQRALAGAIVAYAEHIENPSVLADAVELIAQKHASLTIRPEHYPIVGDNLLASIREVLGEAATDDIIDAWAAAYGELAAIFIDRESEIYTEQAQQQGWSGFKPFTIVDRRVESDTIVSFLLAPTDGAALPPHRAGQYVSVRLPNANGEPVMRNYSLSSAPNAASYRISVKRERGGEGPDGEVSARLHEAYAVGDMLEVTPPCGTFVLELPEDETRPLIFIAGGVGVTPLISMAHAALAASNSRPVIFVQAARHEGVRAFGEELETLQREHANVDVRVRYSETSATGSTAPGAIDGSEIADWTAGRESTFYFCGPHAMMQEIDALLASRGVEATDRRFECFGPLHPLAA
ncbi:NO-inducible flavohemoprotein [Salinicola aestuarinus]|uniref:NO-inducible flavohemoprotein n=1 Tax=Salinicola aestuarinus TaxID=1949082 RepID=UPI000DA1A9B8|nr:NO-inducible flavohemoprotein [Salinicola aestuarinus]